MEQSGFAQPPQKRTACRDSGLDGDSGGTDGGSLPFIIKYPDIGDVAVKARCENQQHEPHFVTLAPQLFAGQTMSELMQDLDATQQAGHQQHIFGVQPGPSLGEASQQLLILDGDQQDGRSDQQTRQDHCPEREQPTATIDQPTQQSVRIKSAKTKRQQVRQTEPAAGNVLRHGSRDEQSAVAGLLCDQQSLLDELPDEPCEFIGSQRVWSKLFVEPFAKFENRNRLIKLIQDKRFFVTQFEIGQCNRILDIASAQAIPRRDLLLEVSSAAPGDCCSGIHISPVLRGSVNLCR